MFRKLMFKALNTLVAIAALLLFILGVIPVAGFEWFDWQNCVILALLCFGVLALLRALLRKKMFSLYLAAALCVAAVIWAGYKWNFLNLGDGKNWIYFLIGGVVLLVFVFLRYLFNVRKWDAGDNEKVTYSKDFRKRQEEKDRLEIENQIADIEKDVRKIDREKAILQGEIEERELAKKNIGKKK